MAASSALPSSGVPRMKVVLSHKLRLYSSIGAAMILCSLWTLLGTIVVPIAMRHDFLVTYTAARMASKGEYARLHDPVLMLERMREIDRDTLAAPVVRPHFYAFL